MRRYYPRVKCAALLPSAIGTSTNLSSIYLKFKFHKFYNFQVQKIIGSSALCAPILLNWVYWQHPHIPTSLLLCFRSGLQVIKLSSFLSKLVYFYLVRYTYNNHWFQRTWKVYLSCKKGTQGIGRYGMLNCISIQIFFSCRIVNGRGITNVVGTVFSLLWILTCCLSVNVNNFANVEI